MPTCKVPFRTDRYQSENMGDRTGGLQSQLVGLLKGQQPPNSLQLSEGPLML